MGMPCRTARSNDATSSLVDRIWNLDNMIYNKLLKQILKHVSYYKLNNI